MRARTQQQLLGVRACAMRCDDDADNVYNGTTTAEQQVDGSSFDSSSNINNSKSLICTWWGQMPPPPPVQQLDIQLRVLPQHAQQQQPQQYKRTFAPIPLTSRRTMLIIDYMFI